MKYSNSQIRSLIDAIYDGTVTDQNLPEDLYFAIANYFKQGLYDGFGMTLAEAAGRDLELLTELRENTYIFSAAKTHAQVKDIQSLLVDAEGNMRTSREFNKLGMQAYDTWNNEWGKTEYITTVGQAQMAGKWNEIERNKEALPILKYVAVEDANTSPECRAMDGITAHVDDKIWDKNSPLQHFRCRCLLLQHEDGEPLSNASDKAKALETVNENKNPLFDMNPGKDGYVFGPEHPYFKVAPGEKAYAKRNYDLPIPKTDD